MKSQRKRTFLNTRDDLIIVFFLIVSTFAVYSQTRSYEFVNYDDNAYVYENPQVLNGLTVEGLSWALTATHSANWHPLTWISHMLDIQLYGLNPGDHHLTNVLIHIANTLLLFFVLAWMTGALWKSGLVAALFALHPLHVESVAWVAERKDVLSTFFWMLTMLFYVWYAKRPGIKKYLATLGCFILGLMAKPMLVTLPFVLLLLDIWPLGRSQIHVFGNEVSQGKVSFSRLLLEKSPFFIFSAVSCLVTYWTQQSGGAIAPSHLLPLDVRLANAIVSYVHYLIKAVWPGNLSVLYPHPGMPPAWQTAGAALILTLATALALRKTTQLPWLLVGWLWYAGTLVPVIGVVQVGSQAMADRYTYIPLIGIFIIITWSIPKRFLERQAGKATVIAGCLVILFAFSLLSWRQACHWRNPVTLFTHAIEVSGGGNFYLHTNLANALARRGRLKEALPHYDKAMALQPDYRSYILNNIGAALMVSGDYRGAMGYFQATLKENSGNEDARRNLALAHARLQESDKDPVDPGVDDRIPLPAVKNQP